MKQTPVYLAIFLAVVCMSTSSIMIRFCTAPAMVIALYRVVFTVGLAGLLENRSLPGNAARLRGKDLLLIAAAGFFLALHFGFWITSLSYTSVSSSVLFTNLQVIFVVIFSVIILREKINVGVLAGIATALIGSLFIVHGDCQSGRMAGDLLALASGLFVAVYFLITRTIRSRVETMTYTMLVSAAAALVLGAANLIGGWPLSGYPPMDWLLFFLMALGPGLGGHAVLSWALKFVKAPVVAVSVLGESVGASLLAFFIFGEYLLWYQIVGGLLILTGIYTAATHESTSLTTSPR